MGKALSMDSSVSCWHRPPGSAVPPNAAKLAVSGQRVLVQSSIKTTGGLAIMPDSLAGTANGKISPGSGTLTVAKVQAKAVAL